MTRIVSLLALLAASCGGGPSRDGDGRPGEPRPGEPGPVPRETLYLDGECLLQCREAHVLLPRSLRKAAKADSLVGGWDGDAYTGRGNVDFRVRRLRVVCDRITVVPTDGPVANLRVRAEGEARIVTPTTDQTAPGGVIFLKPDQYLFE